jgi:hypothetical protein
LESGEELFMGLGSHDRSSELIGINASIGR